MTKRFKNAYTALVKAYFDDTLDYMSPCGCAVGNMIAYSLGYSVKKFSSVKDDDISSTPYIKWKNSKGNYISGNWGDVIIAGTGKLKDLDFIPQYYIEEIESTGYSIKEIALIEQRFAELNGYFPVGKAEHPLLKWEKPKDFKEIPNHEQLYQLIQFIAELDGETLELENNPFSKTKERALELV